MRRTAAPRCSSIFASSDIRTGGAAMPSAPDIAEGPLRDVLPDVPFTPLRDGIARTFAFYRDGSL